MGAESSIMQKIEDAGQTEKQWLDQVRKLPPIRDAILDGEKCKQMAKLINTANIKEMESSIKDNICTGKIKGGRKRSKKKAPKRSKKK